MFLLCFYAVFTMCLLWFYYVLPCFTIENAIENGAKVPRTVKEATADMNSETAHSPGKKHWEVTRSMFAWVSSCFDCGPRGSKL